MTCIGVGARNRLWRNSKVGLERDIEESLWCCREGLRKAQFAIGCLLDPRRRYGAGTSQQSDEEKQRKNREKTERKRFDIYTPHFAAKQ